ncbi:MAG: glycosyltransferase family 2 protein, partial [Planctomycetota bacterium]|nr:glycosyltransferase family 2 protein [Planctomycetota bacterium]
MSNAFAPLSVCIIGQNVAGRIAPLLEQAASLAGEIVFVDGGSTDGTVDLVRRQPKAKLVARAFDGNFAKQKNAALAQARGDWILFLDTDELAGPGLIRLLPHLLASRFTGFNLPRYWLAQDDPPRYVDSEKHYPDRQLRLFRNRPELRYDESRPVHEAIPREARGQVLGLRSGHILHYCFLWEDR